MNLLNFEKDEYNIVDKFKKLDVMFKSLIYEKICKSCNANCGSYCIFLAFLMQFNIALIKCSRCGGDAFLLKKGDDEITLCLDEKVLF